MSSNRVIAKEPRWRSFTRARGQRDPKAVATTMPLYDRYGWPVADVDRRGLILGNGGAAPRPLWLTLDLVGSLANEQPVGRHHQHATDDSDDDALDVDAGHIGDS